MPEILDITFKVKGKISFKTRPLILKYFWIIENSDKVPSRIKKILNRELLGFLSKIQLESDV